MKRLALLMAMVALATAADLWAGDQPGKPGGGKIVVKEGAGQGAVLNAWGAGKSAATWYIESIDKIVGLTDAQKKAITGIIEARDKAMKDFQTQNAEKTKAAGNAFSEAYKSKDKEAIAKAQKDYQALYAPMQEIMKKAQADLTNVLTAQQKNKLHENRVMSMIKAWTDPAQLTEEQVKKIKAAVPQDGDQGAMAQKLPQVIQETLTPEQKATIAKHRAMSYVKSMFFHAKLTADQLKQVEAVCDEMVKGQTVTAQWNWEGYKKLSEKVNGLLTDEQKEAMKKVRSSWGQPGSAARGGFGPGAPAGDTKKAPEKKTEHKQPGIKVTQIPGGGLQITISEGGEAREAAPGAIKMRAEAIKATKARMRERIKRQHELAEQAWQICQKMEALGEGKQGEAHQLWEQLERIEGDLRRTFEPSVAMGFPGIGAGVRYQPGALMPGAPSGGVPNREAMARRLKELSDKLQQLTKEGKTDEAQRAKHEVHELHETLERLGRQPHWQPLEQPGRPMQVQVRPDPAVQELRTQVQDLRRQVEEIKAQLKKTHEHQKK